MQIVLPGALPDAREARELIPYLLKAAPTLVHWLENSSATQTLAEGSETGCTPYEQWLLHAHGYTPDTGQKLVAGLGPLWAGNDNPPDQALWLAELVHLAPSRDGAALLPAVGLGITTEQSVALFESARALFEPTEFTLQPLDTERWRVTLPEGFAPDYGSPTLVSLTSVNEWWPQDRLTRPWRRLVNELQMLWFDHPVNQARYQQGLAPVNSLWLFGGGRGEQFKGPQANSETQIHSELLGFSIVQDWGGWIAALTELEARVFRSWPQREPPRLVLLGRNKIVETRPNRWLRWVPGMPGRRDSWRKWWSPQN
jgi:hypothetical protein